MLKATPEQLATVRALAFSFGPANPEEHPALQAVLAERETLTSAAGAVCHNYFFGYGDPQMDTHLRAAITELSALLSATSEAKS